MIAPQFHNDSPTASGGGVVGEDVAPDERLLRLRDVADRCQVSLRTVEGWVAGGRLPVVRLSPRVVRVTEEALAEFLKEAEERAR